MFVYLDVSWKITFYVYTIPKSTCPSLYPSSKLQWNLDLDLDFNCTFGYLLVYNNVSITFNIQEFL